MEEEDVKNVNLETMREIINNFTKRCRILNITNLNQI
jgi:hypothetical protein